MTYSQLKRNPRVPKPKRRGNILMKGKPQRAAMCVSLTLMSPKKPNSANRAIAKLKFRSGGFAFAVIPGEGFKVREYNRVMVRGSRSKDLPGVRRKIVIGILDRKADGSRITSRSKYGTERVPGVNKSIFFIRESNKVKQINRARELENA